VDELDEEGALRCERLCIEHYGRRKHGGQLMNILPGGEMPAGAEHPRAATYKAISPNGKEYMFTGLRAFCREHDLSPQGLANTASGTNPTYKGWSCVKWDGAKWQEVNSSVQKRKKRGAYVAIDPNGNRFYISPKGLASFCKPLKLHVGAASQVALGRRHHHKGWVFNYA
jgi:hypothetical protein